MSKLLSVIIPAYNRGDIIHETIESVLGQTEPFAEIIVVDDGSKDNTAQVLASFGDRIRTIRVPNGGVQAARNVGVEAASAPYIVLCDSDDLLAPEFVATIQARLAARPDTDVIYVNFLTFDQNGVHADKFSAAPPDFFAGARLDGEFYDDIPELYKRSIAFQPFFPTGSVMSKALYQRLGGFDRHFNGVGSEDWEFTLRAISAGKVAVCRRPLAKLRRHAGNDSGDAMRQARGEADILEFALAHHPAASAHRDIILDSIEARRLAAFDLAFARASFDVAADLRGRLRAPPRDLKFRLKELIMSLPGGPRALLWRWTQR